MTTVGHYDPDSAVPTWKLGTDDTGAVWSVEWHREAAWDVRWVVVSTADCGTRSVITNTARFFEAVAVVTERLKSATAGEAPASVKPWTFEPLELHPITIWEVYDPNLGRIVGSFNRQVDGEDYLRRANKCMNKKAKRQQSTDKLARARMRRD